MANKRDKLFFFHQKEESYEVTTYMQPVRTICDTCGEGFNTFMNIMTGDIERNRCFGCIDKSLKKRGFRI